MSPPSVIEVNGRPTRVRIDGHPDMPPILLLHGIGRSLEDWAPQNSRLNVYRTIALDLPGFGFSARPSRPMSLRAVTDAVLETLDLLREHRPLHVVGNSVGGAVGLQLLTLQPRRVASLTLVNSAGFGSEANWILRLLATPVLGSLSARHPTRAAARMLERTIFADPSLATTGRIDHALTIARERPDAGAALHELACELGTLGGFRSRWRKDLITQASRHRVPTLIVWGDRDRILPAAHLSTARRLLPHTKAHLFPGIGHMPQIECPDEFAQVLLGFIASQARTAQPD
jgi:pimeloyl-ACP methyl ester carboxylesterase